jgi:hypothetical protein
MAGVYGSPEEVRMAYDSGELELHAEIKVRIPAVRVTETGDTRRSPWARSSSSPDLDAANRLIARREGQGPRRSRKAEPTTRCVETTTGRVMLAEGSTRRSATRSPCPSPSSTR